MRDSRRRQCATHRRQSPSILCFCSSRSERRQNSQDRHVHKRKAQDTRSMYIVNPWPQSWVTTEKTKEKALHTASSGDITKLNYVPSSTERNCPQVGSAQYATTNVEGAVIVVTSRVTRGRQQGAYVSRGKQRQTSLHRNVQGRARLRSRTWPAGRYWEKTRKVLQCSPNTFGLVEPPP